MELRLLHQIDRVDLTGARPVAVTAQGAAIEADLLIILMQAPGIVRLPLVAAAVLVRLARG